MKTLITTITLIFSISLSIAQSPQYQQKMGEALGQYAQVNSVDAYKAAAANFERIAQVETTEWLPLYYHAQSYILMSFADKKASNLQKDDYLATAEESINKMITLAPNETEIFALQAFYYTAKLVIDPMNRGPKYGALTEGAIQKSLALDANNPRAKQLRLSNKIGTANFFGQDTAPYCEEAHQLLAVWDNYPVKSPFYPTWGKNQVIELINNCPATTVETEATEKTETTEKKSTVTTSTSTLSVTIDKLASDKGQIMLELLDENEQTVRKIAGIIKNNESTLTIDGLENGVYSIRFFHDENENGEMDKSKRGIPTESYGFSNNAKGFMSAPKYKKTLFTIDGNTTLQLKAR